MKKLLLQAARAVLLSLLISTPAWANYTQTLPEGLFMVDERIAISRTTGHWNNDGDLGPLIDEIVRYEPGAGLQGTITTNANARYTVLINMISYGITDAITASLAVPIVLNTTVEPNLGWIEGDYSNRLGRPYSDQDFWEWAGSMGQPKPGKWTGNNGVLSDIVIGGRWRFSDELDFMHALNLAAAVTLYGSIPTGIGPEPEEVAAAGTASWNLHAQGEAGLHLAVEKFFPDSLDGRLILGLKLFHEIFLPRAHKAGTGAIHPLLQNQAPYVGEEYDIDPGDFTGVELGVGLILVKGPTDPNWLTDDPAMLPPMLSCQLSYNFTLVGQSDWHSESDLWDWKQEEFWKPGYKNILQGTMTLSLMRLGIPVQVYAGLRSIALLPGKNARAPNLFSTGLMVPVKFW